ncbi:MAG: SAM-dependent methyltransferase [Sphingobacteriales bacterium]|uniref:Eco57I restriction-modification methylase domain-containing protein n=1 Tax=Hydrotalea flava TaxID=714549 RepID=UPI00082D5CF6|nr:DNA methyltransferase [Hydrotalea flava]RTL47663.1 MAG: SAM-dependent methyltransferase [Sphingobacteriales bacterium]
MHLIIILVINVRLVVPKRHYPKAFNADGELWAMVKKSGDRYIYDAVKKGVELPLPDEIAIGLDTTKPNLLERRKEWNKPATINYALPTEIWREVVERRNRYTEVKTKIDKGEITTINDFITYNLNIRQFAQDVVENTNDPEWLKHFYKALNSVTIIDPTCGSGAFLFAAMNILEPLYEACIQRMEIFIEEAKDENNYKHLSPELQKSWKSLNHKESWFRQVLAQVKSPEHPNLQYFIYKSIILRNLYGVDIMKEAVEIAKLRLFLKLVATVEADYRKPNLGLEPLPDIDFNIRAGNTLVGFATEAELQKGLTYTLDGAIAKPLIEEKCEIVANAFKRYKEIQLTYGDDFKEFKKAKAELNKRLKELNHELNQLLYKQATAYKYEDWLNSHQPFHWFAEFYEILQDNGGFDVIIGNPPYVELKVAEKSYKLYNSEYNIGGNLHSIVAARAINFLNEKGCLGFIVPVAISNTDRMESLRKLFVSQGPIWVSNYSIRPGKLFSGAEQRLSIYIYKINKTEAGKIWTSKYYKWNKEEREFLFTNHHLTEFQTNGKQIWYKIPNSVAKSILDKINSASESIAKYSRGNKQVFYKNTGIGYYVTTTLQPPICYINGKKASSSRETTVNFETEDLMHIFHSILSSSTFFLFYQARSNCRDLNPSDISSFKFPLSILNDKLLVKLSKKLQESLDNNSWFQIRNQIQTGEVKIQSFTSSLSKPIIDEIDTVLAQHYGFTDEELDFIINYDIKYRMGKELESEDE